MITFFKKTWYIFVIIIVLYVVLGRLNVLPGSINFLQPKVAMVDTPVLVKEIKEIGEFVTAEYYGEVYADLFEAFEYEFNSLDTMAKADMDSLFSIFPHLEKYKEAKEEYLNLQKEIEKRNAQLPDLVVNLETIQNDVIYFSKQYNARKDELDQLNRRKDREKYKKAKKLWEDAKDNLEKVQDRIKRVQKQIQEIQDDIDDLKDDLEDAEDDFKRYKQKNNLVYIGRGFVKAGYDLKSINPGKDIWVDSDDSLTVHFRIPEVEILDSVINPWFIPNQIKGYEIFIQEGNDYSHAEVTRIKISCVQKLAKVAREKGILDMAKKSGEDALERFFQLLGFEKVVFEMPEKKTVPTQTPKEQNNDNNENNDNNDNNDNKPDTNNTFEDEDAIG